MILAGSVRCRNVALLLLMEPLWIVSGLLWQDTASVLDVHGAPMQGLAFRVVRSAVVRVKHVRL